MCSALESSHAHMPVVVYSGGILMRVVSFRNGSLRLGRQGKRQAERSFRLRGSRTLSPLEWAFSRQEPKGSRVYHQRTYMLHQWHKCQWGAVPCAQPLS